MRRSCSLLAFALLCASSCAQTVVPPAPVRLTQCTQGPLRNDTLRVLDVRAGTLSLTLSSNGASIAPEQLDGARLVFRAVDRRSEATIQLGADAVNGFSAMIATGTYDVFFAKGPRVVDCRSANAGLPCLGGAVARGVQVREGSQSLALDVAPQTYRVRIVPSALRASEAREYSLRCDEQWISTAPATGPTEIEFSALPTKCSLYSNAADPSRYESLGNRGVFEQTIALEPQQRELVATLRAADVRVTMEANLGDFSAQFFARSHLEARLVDRSDAVYFAQSLVGTNDTLTMALVPGTYDIDWVMDNRFAESDAVSVRVPIARGAQITGDTTLRHALDLVRVEALVETERAPAARREDDIHTVIFSSPDGTSVEAGPNCRPTSTRNRFRTWAPRGATQARVSATLYGDRDSLRSFGDFAIDPAATQSEGVVVVRAEALQIAPSLWIDGREYPRFPAGTYATRLNDEQLQDESVWLSAAVRTFAGTRDVVFGAVIGVDPDPAFPIPTTVGVVQRGLVATQSGATRVQLHTVPLWGTVLLNGESFVAHAGREATVRVERVRFSGVGSPPDPAQPAAITTQNGALSSVVFEDDYTVRVDQGSCTSAEAATRLCGSVLVHGCEP
ncbi:MAG: hypothetical protein U0269_14705 [Polyangiales bacterium]